MKKTVLNFLFVVLLITALVTTGCISTTAEALTATTVQPAAVQEPVQALPEVPQVTEVPYSSSEILFEYSNNTTNAIVAMQYLNGTVLQPWEIFSFNQVIGKRTLARHFITGKDINNNDSVGGGVCRLATLIYQTARLGGFNIVERWPHSKSVHYAKKGWDATVQYGSLDFSFQNNGYYPIKIYASSTPQENGVLLKVSIVCLVNN